MSEEEGVVKYKLQWRPGMPPARQNVLALTAWRGVLFKLGLIGEGPDGIGYGNLSRVAPNEKEILITGTQTSQLETLTERPELFYSRVLAVEDNLVEATGTVKPSSEVMTHAAIYRACPSARFVFHVHSPEIWNDADEFRVPSIPEDVKYGTKEMANAVIVLHAEHPDARIFVTKGHRDGVFVFGEDVEKAAATLVKLYAWANLRC